MSYKELYNTVIKTNLCCSCGSCAGICPTGNITFSDTTGKCLPKDNGMCLETCSLCTQVCPGKNLDLSDPAITGGIAFKPGIGFSQKVMLFRAENDSIREKSTSGGAVTALLCSMLDLGLIDGVIAIGPDKTDPTRTSANITYDKKGILANIQSRYCVAPLNNVLNLLEKDKKYAFVGLPCMIDGLHKMMKVKKSLKENIVITLGLFCHSTMYYSATRELIKYSGLDKSAEIKQIKYREGSFPGGFQAQSAVAKSQPIHLSDYMILFNHHLLNRCRLCVNHYNAYADLAFADPFPFISELGDDYKWSVTLARTEAGQAFLETVLTQGHDLQKRIVTQKNIDNMDKKHRTIQQIHLNQLAMNKKLRLPTPEFGLPLPPHSLPQALFNLLRVHVFKDIMLTSREIIKKIRTLKFVDEQYKKLFHINK